MMGNTNRIGWVDVLKGISIIWLIVYHFYVFDWMRSPVPVFFFLSGLFFNEGRNFISFVEKKAKALLIPFVFFFLLGILASALGYILQGKNYSFPSLWKLVTLIPASVKEANPLGVGAIWFLLSLFEIYIIYYVLRLLSNNRWWLLCSGLLLFLISCTTMKYFAMGSIFYLFYTFAYCIFFIVAHQMREKVLYGTISNMVLVLAVCAYLVRFVDVNTLLNQEQLNFFWGGDLNMIKWLISMSGLITLLIWLCKKISSINSLAESKTYSFILFEGSNSLTILGIHLIVMSVATILLRMILQEGIMYYILMFLVIIIVCNICIMLFNSYVPYLVNHKK